MNRKERMAQSERSLPLLWDRAVRVWLRRCLLAGEDIDFEALEPLDETRGRRLCEKFAELTERAQEAGFPDVLGLLRRCIAIEAQANKDADTVVNDAHGRFKRYLNNFLIAQLTRRLEEGIKQTQCHHVERCASFGGGVVRDRSEAQVIVNHSTEYALGDLDNLHKQAVQQLRSVPALVAMLAIPKFH